MRQGEQPEARARRTQPAEGRFFLRLRLDRPHQRVERQVKKQQQQHLRQTGERVAPENIAHQHHDAGEQGQPFVKKTTRHQEENRDRRQEEEHRHQRDHFVADVNGFASDREMRTRRKKRDRVDQWRQRRLVGVGPNFSRGVAAVALQLPDRERARHLRFPKPAMQHFAPDLRLVHRLRRRQALKLVQQKKDRHPHDQCQPKGAPDPDRGTPGFEGVDQALHKISATGHRSDSLPSFRSASDAVSAG